MHLIAIAIYDSKYESQIIIPLSGGLEDRFLAHLVLSSRTRANPRRQIERLVLPQNPGRHFFSAERRPRSQTFCLQRLFWYFGDFWDGAQNDNRNTHTHTRILLFGNYIFTETIRAKKSNPGSRIFSLSDYESEESRWHFVFLRKFGLSL